MSATMQSSFVIFAGNRFSTDVTVQILRENTLHLDKQLCTEQELFYVNDIKSAIKNKADQFHRGVIEWHGDIRFIKTEDVTMNKDIFSKFKSLIVHWQVDTVNELGDIMPLLVAMLSYCQKITRLTLWLRVANLATKDSISMRPLCTVLENIQNLRWLDLNIVKGDPLHPDLKTEDFSLAKLIPRLKRFSLGNCTINAMDILSEARQGPFHLQHLKLDCENAAFDIDQFGRQLNRLEKSFTQRVTSLSLKYSNELIIPFVTTHFTKLRSLKLMSSQAFDRRFDQKLVTSLSILTHLTELTLINFYLLQQSQIKFSLPSVTTLTLTFRGQLIFRPDLINVNVASFTLALFVQFPAVRELTLVGPVNQAKRVRHQLKNLLKNDLEQLEMHFEDITEDESQKCFSGNDILLDCLLLIFNKFELNELMSLRVICGHWNTAALGQFSNRSKLTLQVNDEDPEFRSQLCSAQELFYIDDIVKAHKEIERNRQSAVIDSVGKIVSIDAQHVDSFVETVNMYSMGKLKHLIVHWKTTGRLIMPHLNELINSCAQLTRLSVWFHTDCIPMRHIPLQIGPFCRDLGDHENLEQLDMNIMKRFSAQANLSVAEYDLTHLLPGLQRLSLGNCDIDLTRHLALAGRQLSHLKLALDDGTISFGQFRDLITNPNTEFTTSVTSLALMSVDIAAIELVSTHFTQLIDFKLVNSGYKRNFDSELITTLGRLVHLTDLKLINYDFLPTHDECFSLPSVIKLTLTSSIYLFKHFYTEYDHFSPRISKINVASFTLALFAQFPAVRELTLTGLVYQAEQVRQRLREALKPRIRQLHMFFIDSRAPGKEQTRYCVRKSLGNAGTAHRNRFGLKRI